MGTKTFDDGETRTVEWAEGELPPISWTWK